MTSSHPAIFRLAASGGRQISPQVFIEEWLTQGLLMVVGMAARMPAPSVPTPSFVTSGPMPVTGDSGLAEYECAAGLGANLGVFDPQAIRQDKSTATLTALI